VGVTKENRPGAQMLAEEFPAGHILNAAALAALYDQVVAKQKRPVPPPARVAARQGQKLSLSRSVRHAHRCVVGGC
jgi:hypothetical protein